jgi:hypothetical protein
VLTQLGPNEARLPDDNANDEDIIQAIQRSFVEQVGNAAQDDEL